MTSKKKVKEEELPTQKRYKDIYNNSFTCRCGEVVRMNINTREMLCPNCGSYIVNTEFKNDVYFLN